MSQLCRFPAGKVRHLGRPQRGRARLGAPPPHAPRERGLSAARRLTLLVGLRPTSPGPRPLVLARGGDPPDPPMRTLRSPVALSVAGTQSAGLAASCPEPAY